MSPCEDDEIAGFASLKGADHVEMIYVDPEFARQGVGATLLDALEKLARARGADKLTGEVSDTAKPLFDRQGFVSEQRNVVQIDDEWLGNTTHEQNPRRRSPPTKASMTRERLYLFDTTLRDGAQTTGVDFSLDDKRHIAAMLDDLGDRLCRGRLSRRQPARHQVLREEADQARASSAPSA